MEKNTVLKLYYPDGGDVTIAQAFRVGTNEDYTVTFKTDPSQLYKDVWSNTYQDLYFRLYYTDGSSNLSVYHPHNLTSKTAEKFREIKSNFDQREGGGIKSFRFHTADYDRHTIYDHDGSAYTTFSFCDTSTGANCDGTITHAALSLNVSDDGLDSSYNCMDTTKDCSVSLDDIFVDRENQVEIELVNSGGEVVQSSTLDKGMLIGALSDDVKIRIYLRSYKKTESPSVSDGNILSGLPITVEAGDIKLNVTSNRFASGYIIPPKSEYEDETMDEIRSKCIDNFNGGAEVDCSDYDVENGATLARVTSMQGGIIATWNDSIGDYDLSLDDTFLFVIKNRWGKGIDAGINPTIFLPDLNTTLYYPGGDNDTTERDNYCDEYVAPDTSNECCYNSDGVYRTSNMACTINNFPDKTGTRSGDEQSKYMMTQIVSFFATIFDGSTAFTDSDWDSVTMPNIDIYEIHGEPNGSGKMESDDAGLDWIDADSEDVLELFDEAAEAIKDARTAAGLDYRIAIPSLLGNNMLFDTDYLSEAVLSYLDPSIFTELTFHPYYNNVDALMPEKAFEKWDEVEEILSDACASSASDCWDDFPIHFTEWGKTHEDFDPECQEDGDVYWERALGDEAFAKITARETLTFLNLPIEGLYRYGNFNNEQEGYLGDCWYAYPDGAFNIMNRKPGGTLDGDSSTYTTYEQSDAGVSFYSISRYLSDASPYESEVHLDDKNSASDNEHYYSALFLGSDGNYYLGLWWYRDYQYGVNDNGYGADYMNYMNDTRDNGFTAQRIHNITLKDIGTPLSATLIPLTGDTESSLTIEENEEGNPVIMGVEFGEMPVLVKLTM